MGGELNPLYGFGPYQIDPENRLLLRSDRPIPLTPKAFDTLLLLVERNGHLVSKDELMKTVWPDAFVSDANLTQTIFMLRRALGDSASEQRFIVTVPGRGYRFTEAVREAPVVNEADKVRTQPAGVRWRLWLPILAVILFTQLPLYRYFAPAPVPKLSHFQPLPVLDQAEPWQELLSDGSRVYFLQRDGGGFRLMRTLPGGQVEKVATPFENTRILAISREQGAFLIGRFTSPEGGLPLWVWSPGAAPVRVGQVLADAAAWHPNGQILYARGNEIHAVQRDGSGDRLFLRVPGAPAYLRFSPDGRRMRFSVTDASATSSMWECNPDGSDAHLMFRNAPGERSCCGEWTADGRYFIYTVLRSGKSDLWALREQWSLFHRNVPVQLTATVNSIYDGLPSAREDRLYVYSDNIQIESARYNYKTGALTPIVPGMQAAGIEFSRDGKWVVFVRLLDRSLWRSRPDGSEAIQLAGSAMRASHPHFSPDGSSVAFEAWLADQPARAYVISSSGGGVQPVSAMSGMQSLPVWSPDGKSLAIAMNVMASPSSGLQRGVFLVNWATRSATRLPNSEGLTSPQWSPDGKHLTAKTLDQKQVFAFDQEHGKWAEVASGVDLSGLTWSRDSRFLYLQDLGVPGQPLYRLRAGDFRRENVTSFETLLLNGLQRCAFSTLDPEGAPIVEVKRNGTRVYQADLELP